MKYALIGCGRIAVNHIKAVEVIYLVISHVFLFFQQRILAVPVMAVWCLLTMKILLLPVVL